MGPCSICSGKYLPVMGQGPQPCPVMLIGERPGRNENNRHKPFVGDSGSELDGLYLRLAGLNREDVYVTNAVKCYAEGNKKPTGAEVQCCASHHLPEEVRQCSPTVIVLLGATACSLVDGIQLDVEHGIPKHVESTPLLGGYEGWVVPMYHPASGLHDTRNMKPMMEDWQRFGEWLKGQWVPPQAEPVTHYTLLDSNKRFRPIYGFSPAPVAMDTESMSGKLWSVQVSSLAGWAYMLTTTQLVINETLGRGNLASLRRIGIGSEFTVILHNALYDLEMLRQIKVEIRDFRDTMQEAYHLGLPQSLKTLGYRLCGVKMKGYEETVLPHSKEALTTWLYNAIEYALKNMRIVKYVQLKTREKTIYKPHPVVAALRRIYRSTLSNEDYDPWKRVDELEEKDRLAGAVGECPRPGIAHVPEAEAVHYGCQDADITLRVARVLQEIRNSKRFEIAEEDVDQ